MENSVDTTLPIRPGVEPGLRPAAARRWMLMVLVFFGFATSVLYFGWWFRDGRIYDPWLALCFAMAAFYVGVQVYCACYLYLRIEYPETAAAPPDCTVDVFIPVYDEPHEMVAQCLEAALAIRYPHRTFLLDDARDPRFKALAERLGVEYLVRPDNRDAKAGNVNAALKASKAEFVSVFDVDHIPQPDYLDSVLGHFRDVTVGFVQSAVGFSNACESWIARAGVEQSTDALGPTSMGMYGCGAAQVWGSHCTFRRTALDSIGGHQTGLAEDLHTSLRVHAAGWRSVFVPSLKALGLVPGDMAAAAKQQLKWARGVFEILLEVYPRVWQRLSLTQNLAYAVRFTYYLIGTVFLAHALIAAMILVFGPLSARAAFSEYLLHSIPFAASIILVRRAAMSLWSGTSSSLSTNWRGYVHTFLLWPVYTLALVMAVLRIRIPHIATPKKLSNQRAHPILVVPQVLLMGLLVAAVAFRVTQGWVLTDVFPILFALAAAGIQVFAVLNARQPSATAEVVRQD